MFFNSIWWNFFLTHQLWPCHLPHTSMVTSLDCLTSTISKLIHNFNFHCPNHLIFYLITLSILTQTSKKMFYMMCMSLLSAYVVCVPYACLVSKDQKRASNPRVADGCQLSCGCWEIDPSPLATNHWDTTLAPHTICIVLKNRTIYLLVYLFLRQTLIM